MMKNEPESPAGQECLAAFVKQAANSFYAEEEGAAFVPLSLNDYPLL